MTQIDELKYKDNLQDNIEQVIEKKEVNLDRDKLIAHIDANLNESDWIIIQTLYKDPAISNKELADLVALSVEGTKSSLKKMYKHFEIPSSRSMKLSLIIKVIAISQDQPA